MIECVAHQITFVALNFMPPFLSCILVLNLSKVFSDYGYEPKKGVAAVAGQGVTGSKGNRVYYKRPAADQAPVSEEWGL